MAGPVVAAQLEAEIPSTASARLEEPDFSSSNWYFSREEIEKYSPSRKDGIDLKKETYYRRSYCTYLQDLGMRLKVPQVTIATAIVFCHRFFLRQSHARNDRQMIATVCMFLAGKVEETPRHLDEVIKVSYVIRLKKDPNASEKIKVKEVFLKQKELMLLGEKLVLTTLGFDLNIYHPYKPLVAAIKKFKVSQNTLAQVAWNFVNDGLRTSLCLQFKPHHIAAGAIFLAAKFLKIKLSDGDKSWWQEFEVTPRQLEVVSNQMLELYEQNRPPPVSRSSDPSASALPSRAAANGSDAQASPPPESNDVLKPDMDDSKKTSAVSEEMVLSPSVSGSQADVKRSAEERAEAPPHAAATDDRDVEMKVEEPGALPGATDAVDEHKTQEMEVNKDKLKAAVEKRRKARVEGSETKPRQEATDEELLERELESGVEAAVEVERSKSDGPPEKQVKLENGYRREDRGRSEEPRREELPRSVERGRSEDSRRDDRDGKRPKKEEESASKRKRDDSKEDRVAVEEGELAPAGAAHDRSPRRGSSPHDRRRESYGRDQAGYAARRDTFFDGKQHSSSSYRYHNRDYGSGGSSGGSYHHHSSAHHHYSQQHSSQQQQQHHGEWHRAPREAWSDRESKKARYDHGK